MLSRGSTVVPRSRCAKAQHHFNPKDFAVGLFPRAEKNSALAHGRQLAEEKIQNCDVVV